MKKIINFNNAFLTILLILMIFGLCSCGSDSGLKVGKYFLVVNDIKESSSYIEVKNKDTMVLNNIDVTELVDAEISMLEEFNGSIVIPNSDGTTTELKMGEASIEEIDNFKALRKTSFEGEKKFSIMNSEDVATLHFNDNDVLPVGEIVKSTNTIIISSRNYVLEK